MGTSLYQTTIGPGAHSLGKCFSYILLSSTFGTLGLVWQGTQEGPKVHKVLLPQDQTPTEQAIKILFVGAHPLSCPEIMTLGEQIGRFLEGADIVFPLDLLALETRQPFQRRVLLAEHQIPRGWVSTYGRIATSLGVPRAARAVGNALARNPFPILIPCHRAIQSGGGLGGFQGGVRIKRALLELEGVEFSPTGRVVTDRVYY
jgi:methylated-DNA-[protein]-cysteine S-methyltransferase